MKDFGVPCSAFVVCNLLPLVIVLLSSLFQVTGINQNFIVSITELLKMSERSSERELDF